MNTMEKIKTEITKLEAETNELITAKSRVDRLRADMQAEEKSLNAELDRMAVSYSRGEDVTDLFLNRYRALRDARSLLDLANRAGRTLGPQLSDKGRQQRLASLHSQLRTAKAKQEYIELLHHLHTACPRPDFEDELAAAGRRAGISEGCLENAIRFFNQKHFGKVYSMSPVVDPLTEFEQC